MPPAKYYQNVSMGDGKIGGACNTYEEDGNCIHWQIEFAGIKIIIDEIRGMLFIIRIMTSNLLLII